MKILFLSAWLPYPADNGSKIRIYNLLQGLSEQHEVTLLTFSDQPHNNKYAPELRSLCQEIRVVSWHPFNPNSWRARTGYFSSKPRMIVDTYSDEMAYHISQALSTQRFDLIVASQFIMAMYASLFGGVPAIFEELELGTYHDQFRNAHGWHRVRHALTWQKHRGWLSAMMKNFQACTVVSQHELELAKNALPGHHSFKVIPNCVSLDTYQGVYAPARSNTLIFTGSFTFQPNYEAVCWFLQEVYPQIQGSVPEAHLTITGNHADLPLPDASSVTRTGYVDDVRPYIAGSWCAIVPIFKGGGTRLKILESMALGVPVVATPKGAEGLDVRHAEHLLLADTPQSFADMVIRLLRQPELRDRLARNAYRLVQQHYDWRVVTPRFIELVEQVAMEPRE